jgi:amino-acid N-acetyltransferase
MPNTIDINQANSKNREAIVSLLQSASLPVEDLPQELRNFFIATDNGHVIGAIGLETYERNGLLRSLVVKPEYRKMKVAADLINELEKLAKSLGLQNVYLLTETAQGYFSTKGYETIGRDEAPGSLKQSTEFSHVCPSSAVLMKKMLTHY